jgi:hypothetical protein
VIIVFFINNNIDNKTHIDIQLDIV